MSWSETNVLCIQDPFQEKEVYNDSLADKAVIALFSSLLKNQLGPELSGEQTRSPQIHCRKLPMLQNYTKSVVNYDVFQVSVEIRSACHFAAVMESLEKPRVC